MFPCIFYFFHSPQPNNIGPACQQPRDWGSLNFSESGGGGGHSYYLLALRLLDYMGFAMEKSTAWKMEGGGHTLQFHSIGTGDKCPPPPPKTHPNFLSVLFGAGRGHKSVLSSATRLQKI